MGPSPPHTLGLTCLERVKPHRAEDTEGVVSWGGGGGIKAAFLEEELEGQQWEQAGLDGIGGKAGFRVSKDPGPSQCPHSSPPSSSASCPFSAPGYFHPI